MHISVEAQWFCVSLWHVLLNSLSLIQQPSSFAQARRIIKSDGFGLKGLNKGLTSTLGRHGVFNMIYFGFYFNVKDAIPASPVICQSKSMITLWPPLLFWFLVHKCKPHAKWLAQHFSFLLVFAALTTMGFCYPQAIWYIYPSHLTSGE